LRRLWKKWITCDVWRYTWFSWLWFIMLLFVIAERSQTARFRIINPRSKTKSNT